VNFKLKYDYATKTPVLLSSSLLDRPLLKLRAPLPAKSSLFRKVILYSAYKIKIYVTFL